MRRLLLPLPSLAACIGVRYFEYAAGTVSLSESHFQHDCAEASEACCRDVRALVADTDGELVELLQEEMDVLPSLVVDGASFDPLDPIPSKTRLNQRDTRTVLPFLPLATPTAAPGEPSHAPLGDAALDPTTSRSWTGWAQPERARGGTRLYAQNLPCVVDLVDPA
ncbi:MAG: hypothetical protein JXX28_19390 [Deltaproteobacteria bacterium]|nr:hypothetical protein [Deltaproteobacteria bacterium]